MTNSPLPPVPQDFRETICRLEEIKVRLNYCQASYFRLNKEFWSETARLAALAPSPEDDDEPAYFCRTLLHHLLDFSNNDQVTDYLRNMLNMNSDRAGLALEALVGLFGCEAP